MPSKLVPTSGKALVNYMRRTCIILMTSYHKMHHTNDLAHIPAKAFNCYTVVYGINSAKLKDKGMDTEVTIGILWRLLVLAIKELRVIPEQIWML